MIRPLLLLAVVAASPVQASGGDSIAAPAFSPQAGSAGLVAGQGEAAETIAVIQVHGNVVTPEADILRVAGISVGMAFDPALPGAVEQRLEADGRFVSVEVRKRFASITDLSQITVVILVDEGPVTIQRTTTDTGVSVRTVRSRGLRALFLPVLRYQEGYRVAYGVRLAKTGVLGPRSRVSVPLTWGGERRVGVEADRTFASPLVRRVEGGASLTRRVNPFYRVPDIRQRIGSRVDTQTFRHLRGDAGLAWERVDFLGQQDRLVRASVGVTLDTRVDPLVARNAVLVRLSRERLWSRQSGTVDVTTTDLRGYLGVYRQVVLVARAYRDGASAPLPLFERRLSGGGDVLRGFRVGYATGDTLAAGSLELRVPVTSPLSFARLGVSMFVDAAAVYDVGSRLRDQEFDRGVGGGVWISAAIVRINVAVARGLGRGTRVSVGTNFSF